MENSANDISHSIFDEPKVHSFEAKKQVALAAMSQISGAKETIEKHFNRGILKVPYSFPNRAPVNLKMHHIIGEGQQYM